MCYSNSSTSSNAEISHRYKHAVPDTWKQKTQYFSKGFEFPKWRVILNNEVKIMQWGLVPSWYKPEKWSDIAAKTLNARLETLDSKPSFKNLIAKQHCIIPSDGFFEWQTSGKEKIPFFIYPKDGKMFSMAGIYDVWQDPLSGCALHSFSIITTVANTLMAEIHNTKQRMPFILKENFEAEWLSCKINNLNFDHLIEENRMLAHPVNKRLLLSEHANCKDVQGLFVDNKGIQGRLF